jgi:hypothetical protein
MYISLFVLFFPPLRLFLIYGPWIGALALALMLPKTQKGRVFAMLVALGLIYVDCIVLGWMAGGVTFGVVKYLFEFQFLLLIIVVVVMVCRKYFRESKALFALPFFVGLLFVAFILTPPVQKRMAWYDERQREQRVQVEKYEQWMQTEQRRRDEVMSESCKKASEFIYRKTEHVAGILFLRTGNSYKPEDFLSYWGHGYRYVDEISHNDRLWRYYVEWLGKRVEKNELTSRIAKWNYINLTDNSGPLYIPSFTIYRTYAPESAPPRYAITLKDISTPKEYNNRIVGRSLKVIDLQTQEIMAERISYGMNWRSDDGPLVCPPLSVGNIGQKLEYKQLKSEERKFVEKVLKPS